MNQRGRPPKPLRVIGGQWRSRRLEFPDLPGLRPTPDRVRETVFVEHHPLAVRALRENLAWLRAEGACVEAAEALTWLRQPGTPFEIVFLDPPFGAGLLEPACMQLEQGGRLAATAWIYLEAEAHQPAPVLPTHWTLYREKTAGTVAYRLVNRR